MNDNKVEVYYLPWAGLEDEIQIGPVSFWPFYKMADKKICDSGLRERLNKYFSIYKESNCRKPTKTITICEYNGKDFSEINTKEHQEIINMANYLAFVIVSANKVEALEKASGNRNAKSWAINTDRYELRIRVNPGEEFVYRYEHNKTFGCQFDNFKIQIPLNLSSSDKTHIDYEAKQLIDGFNEMYKKPELSDIKKRILQSIECYCSVFRDSFIGHPISKVAMMATAFEVLLDFGGKKINFAECLKKIYDFKKFPENCKVGENNERDVTIASFWAWNFFDLRNKLVHGKLFDDKKIEEIVTEKFKCAPLLEASSVFRECILLTFFENNCFGDDVRRNFFKFRERGWTSSEGTPTKIRRNFIHNS